MSNPTTVSPATAAASLNNHGVHCFLRTGDLPSSLRLFRRALETVAAAIIPDENEDASDKEQKGRVLVSSLALTPPAQRGGGSADAAPWPSSDVSAKRSENDDDDDDDDDVVLVEASSSSPLEPGDASSASSAVNISAHVTNSNAYVRPINLIPAEGAYHSDPLVNASFVSSILLFNLALVFHAMGLDTGDKPPSLDDPVRRHVVKARVLYRKALHLLRQENDDDDDAMEEDGMTSLPQRNFQHPVLDVLHMALHNNLAAAAYALGDFDECRNSLEELVRLCAQLRHDDDHHDARWAQLDEDTRAILAGHANLFLCNAYFLRTPPQAAAAA